MKLKIVSAAVIAAMLTAFAPTSASAHFFVPKFFWYHHIHKVKSVPAGKHFGGGGGPWLIFACAGGIITSAIVANARQNRELTWNEAASCGLLYWANNQQNPL
jgi:hypothetical protein